MTSYIQTVLDRHFQNYTFTYGIYKDNPQLLTWHYHNALKEIDEMVCHFKKVGTPIRGTQLLQPSL